MSRVVVVTGGTRGIGAAISKAFHGNGDRVVANYGGNDVVATAFSKETGIPVLKWDVADYQACEEKMAYVQETFGPVEVLVNNAGITHDGLIQNLTLAAWQEVIQTNLSSLFYMCRTVLSSMESWGRIINLSSVNGIKGQRGQTNYSASKAGVLGFTRALAQEVTRQGITVNAIAPGYIDTEMVRAVPEGVLEKITAQIPQRRLGKAEEVAHMALFLASKEAGYITGETLSVNGGLWMG